MNEIEKVKLIFLIGCIGFRILFLIIAKNINIKYLPIMGLIAIPISISLIYQYIKKTRKTGAFNNVVWWDNIRPIHAFAYGLFAYMAINKLSYAWIPLLFDVSLGLIAHIYHYY